MSTNGLSTDSDVDTDEYDRVLYSRHQSGVMDTHDRVLFSRHKSGVIDTCFVTRHARTEPLGIEPMMKVDDRTADTTATYERELSQ